MTWLQQVFALFREVERAPEPPLELVPLTPVFDSQGWATTDRFIRIPSQPGWYYKKLNTKSGLPLGIVAHYTATAPGTAMQMAVRRRDRERSSFDPQPGSWHFTVAQDGTVIQQLSLRQGAFHAGSSTAKKLPIGWANHVTVGIELEGHGDKFTKEQFDSACWLWRAIVVHCGIKREDTMYEHAKIDPTRRNDPGKLWMGTYAPDLLNYVFGVSS
jgi:N-acetyl-anhydromuramyl-L-alanine amidase AmpD